MDRTSLIERIVDIEWRMFSSVNNAGGKAACQTDSATFRIMRSSQCATWDEDLLASWLADFEAAQAQGRNLMSEKYARMMESTFPEEYALIADRLPPLDPGAARKIEEIVAIHLNWKEELTRAARIWRIGAAPCTARTTARGCPRWKPICGGNCKPFPPQR